jgi:hypothetical protein
LFDEETYSVSLDRVFHHDHMLSIPSNRLSSMLLASQRS